MQAIKETAANIAASAKSGMEKTRAVVEEKVELMSAHDETEKVMATQKKEERIREAERNKQETYQNNAAARQASNNTGAPHSYSTRGEPGQPTGSHQMSALPGQGTGEPMGKVTGGGWNRTPLGLPPGLKAQALHIIRRLALLRTKAMAPAVHIVVSF